MPRIAACRAPLGRWPMLARSCRPPPGCSRSSGWPGETRSPSSTSHSTTWPPCGADDADPVAQAARRRRSAAPAREHVGARGGLGDRWKVPLAGETTIRQVGVVSMRRALAVLVAERAGVVELVGRLEREGLDALQRALGDAGEGAGRRHLEDAGDAEVAHRVHAEVPADRAGDLADDAGAAPRGRRGRRWPSRLEITGVRGSWIDTERASWASVATAGAMWSVWKAPATLSGISRALAGGSSAQARRAARGCRRRRSGRGRCRWRR